MTRTRPSFSLGILSPRSSSSSPSPSPSPSPRVHLILLAFLLFLSCLPEFQQLLSLVGGERPRITTGVPFAAAFASKIPSRRHSSNLHPSSSSSPSREGKMPRRRSALTTTRGGAAAAASGSGSLFSSASSSSSSPTLTPTTAPTFVESYDGMRKHRVAWDATRRKFQVVNQPTKGDDLRARIERYLRQSFLPDHVTPDYYHYTKWRVLQRLISATVSVFGTRALLLALGLKTERVGLTATFNWIQKDAFGKFGRIMWASKMGRRFDSDAKRWRFRSSLLYAAGTGLEVLTYIFPSAFLLLATIANILKQMSMLTSSATRNAMYKSFAGDSQNLGDITAKGEAQIAVVDLLGILLGIFLSKMIGTAQVGMAVAYIALSAVDVFAIYNEIRSVVFSSLNLERGAMVVKAFVASAMSTAGGGGSKSTSSSDKQQQQQTHTEAPPATCASEAAGSLPTPNQVSRQERIFFDPASIDTSIFRTVSQTGCSLDELHKIREAFGAKDSHFLLTWSPSKGTSIVLHTCADHTDILRALLTWAYFEDAWRREKEGGGSGSGSSTSTHTHTHTHTSDKNKTVWSVEEEKEEAARQAHVLGLLKEAHTSALASEKDFLKVLEAKGWDMRHFVFGKIKKRTDW